jgi:hypothetical protein
VSNLAPADISLLHYGGSPLAVATRRTALSCSTADDAESLRVAIEDALER